MAAFHVHPSPGSPGVSVTVVRRAHRLL